MALNLYNTLTRKKAPFEPIDKDNVRLYVCGPTVYDFAHIGNARPVIVFDVLFRLLRHLYGVEHVTYVRNITDVDDKINARAAQQYPDVPLNEAIHTLTKGTTKQFHEDIAALGVLEPSQEPRATDHIDGMIEMTKVLIEKGHAYEAQGHVLFDVASDKNYGDLSNRSVDEMMAGARVEVADYKKNPMDFVLWKPSTGDEPGWDSPFGEGQGRGRPGWHLECSVMSRKLLGERFDIHGGGLDLIFPHHENEIAQSTCAHENEVMANVWMHNGYLQVEGEKMSKSQGNFITINELLKEWQGEELRFNMLRTHYRQPIDWTAKGLSETRRNLLRLQKNFKPLEGGVDAVELVADGQFLEALCDDLNVHQATSRLFEMQKKIARATGAEKEKLEQSFSASLTLIGFERLDLYSPFGAGEDTMEVKKTQLDEARKYAVTPMPGQDVKYALSKMEPEKLNQMIEDRLAARDAKDWANADRIRDELGALHIELHDGKDPDTGKVITRWDIKR
ncbi:MAG: cysteine--tRNA ligase [Hyphomicrobiaceae bacterium]|nr:cysteine--tRNA ligase [Hyphomicrobiaceae bacterium]